MFKKLNFLPLGEMDKLIPYVFYTQVTKNADRGRPLEKTLGKLFNLLNKVLKRDHFSVFNVKIEVLTYEVLARACMSID